MKKLEQYELFAEVFRFPKSEDYIAKVNNVASFLLKSYPSAYKEFEPFLNFVNNNSFFDIEEVFTRTFHIQAICFLDLGYVLFGEDYKRGEFLVQMKREQREAENDCGEELADNLPNVLKLLSLIEDDNFLQELSVRILIPCIQKMLNEFELSRIALKDKVRKKKQKVVLMDNKQYKNVYQYALQSLIKVLDIDFKGIDYNDPKLNATPGGSFINNCGTCSDLPEVKSVQTIENK